MDTQIRHYRTNLIFSGAAVILFGVWIVLKLLIAEAISSSALTDLYYEQSALYDRRMVAAGIIFVMAVLILLHLYIGLSAIREGRGRKTRVAYLVVACIYGALIVVSYVLVIYSLIAGIVPASNVFSSALIDISFLAALLHMLVSSVRLRRLRRQSLRAETAADD